MRLSVILMTLTIVNFCFCSITDDYDLIGIDGVIYNPNGFTAHYVLSEKIENRLFNSINNAVKSVWQKSNLKTVDLMNSLNHSQYSFILLLEALANNDLVLSYILLDEINKLPAFSLSPEIFERQVIFNTNEIYNSIKQISSNNFPISQSVIENVKIVVNQHRIVAEASSRNDLQLLKWLSDKGCDFRIDGGLAVDIAWKNNFTSLTKLLLLNNALGNISEKYTNIIFSQNKIRQNVLNFAIEIGHTNSAIALIKLGTNVNNRDNNGHFPIHEAIKKNDSNMFFILVKNGADLSVQTKSQNTLLHVASYFGNINAVRYLIREELVIDRENNEGKTPLYLASSGNFTIIMEELIQTGANVSHMNHFGNTLLHVAVRENNINSIENLIHFGADVNAPNIEKVPPLYIAVLNENIPAIETLVSHWANINFKTDKEDSLLHLAASENKLKAISKLITMGCNFKTIDIGNKYDFTPLYSAAIKGNVEAMKLLQKHGANIYSITPSNWSLLHLAVMNNEEVGVKSFLQFGFFVNQLVKWDYTPLHLAVHFSNISIINILINYGAEINAKDHHSKTPIYEATWYGRMDVIEILYNKGADIMITDKIVGALPLHVAARMGYTHIVEFFLKEGVSINSRRNDGKTSLYEATHWGRESTVKFLLKNEADPDIPAIDGQCPLHKAAVFGHTNIAKMLVEAGANINAIDNKNITPLTLAKEHGNRETAMFLLMNGALS